MSTDRERMDEAWKEAIGRFLRPMLALFAPDLEAAIDWSRGYELLDAELAQIARNARVGRRFADRLVKVHLRGGEEAWIAIHVEVQARPESAFPERMYVYNYRIYDRHRRPVVSLAVLADDRPDWRPDRFVSGLFGSESRLVFRAIKLLDFAGRREELERSPNPFAAFVLAHLETLRTRGDTEARLDSKRAILRSLHARGLSREDAAGLVRLVDWLVVLPEEVDRQLMQELLLEEKRRAMPEFISMAERIGLERGLEQGKRQGKRQGVREGLQMALEQLLITRFGELSPTLRARIEKATVADLKRWMGRVLSARSAEAVLSPSRRQAVRRKRS